MKLRLLLFETCDRNCEGCCNQDWDLANLPIVESYRDYDEVLLTGGEPLLAPGLCLDVISQIRAENSKARIYLYTTRTSAKASLTRVLERADGACITLHEQGDVEALQEFITYCPEELLRTKSLRLNVFEGVDISAVDTRYFLVKADVRWIRNCPLPDNEVFKRLQSHRLEVDYQSGEIIVGKCSCGASGYLCQKCLRTLCPRLVPQVGELCRDCSDSKY